MKRITSIFIALSLCTLPCFANSSTIPAKENLKTLCEEGGLPPHGEWNDKRNECKCKEKTYTFDETDGCMPVTTAFTTAKKNLTALESALGEALKTIKAKQTQN